MDVKRLAAEAVRWLCAALVLALMIGGMLKNRTSSAEFGDVRDAVAPTVQSENMQEADAQLAKRLYGLNPADYEGFYLLAPVSNMDAEELLLVKLKDVSGGEALKAAAEARLETQKNAFDGYGTNQFALLSNHASIELRGNFFLFVVSEHADAAVGAFSAAL